MDRLDCGIFNCTPFRGASLDAGTSFEIGYMRVLKKPMFAYTNTSKQFMPRSRTFCFGANYDPLIMEDQDKNRFEEFETMDNLMLDHA